MKLFVPILFCLSEFVLTAKSMPGDILSQVLDVGALSLGDCQNFKTIFRDYFSDEEGDPLAKVECLKGRDVESYFPVLYHSSEYPQHRLKFVIFNGVDGFLSVFSARYFNRSSIAEKYRIEGNEVVATLEKTTTTERFVRSEMRLENNCQSVGSPQTHIYFSESKFFGSVVQSTQYLIDQKRMCISFPGFAGIDRVIVFYKGISL